MWFEIFIILFLILVNGVFSMSEIALVQARKVRLEAAARKGNRGAQLALQLAEHPTRFLSTVQIGITLVGILNGFFSGGELTQQIQSFLEQAKIPYAEAVAIGLVVLLITFFSLVLGELFPKRIGMSNPEAIAKLVAPLMNLLSKITAPFIWLLSATTELFIRIFNIRADETAITEEEIKAVIDEGKIAGTVEEIEQDIMENVFHMGEKRLGSLMTHRTDLVWIDINESVADIRNIIFVDTHRAYPVAEDSLDEVLGIVLLADLVKAILHENEPFDLHKILRKPLYFPETMRGWKALEKFQQSGQSQAFVVDEFGATTGMVTMQDLIDALVGDVTEDPHEENPDFVEREDGSFLIDGRFPFDDFLKEFEINGDDYRTGEFYTLGGFVLYELKRLPDVGEKVHWRSFTFEVMDMDGHRIDKILVSRDAVEEG